MKWFRMYHSIIDSVKVRTMPAEAQNDYILLLCCASEHRERTGSGNGSTGLTVLDAAWRLRSGTLEGTFPTLMERGLATLQDDKTILLNDWNKYQFESDDVAKRTNKSKKKHAGINGNVPGNVGGNVRDTDTDKPKTLAQTPDGFARFWEVYPKKRSKGTAEKAWKKLRPDEQLITVILQAVERATTTAEWQKSEGSFIPYPASWLNAKGWEDDLASAPRNRRVVD